MLSKLILTNLKKLIKVRSGVLHNGNAVASHKGPNRAAADDEHLKRKSFQDDVEVAAGPHVATERREEGENYAENCNHGLHLAAQGFLKP